MSIMDKVREQYLNGIEFTLYKKWNSLTPEYREEIKQNIIDARYTINKKMENKMANITVTWEIDFDMTEDKFNEKIARKTAEKALELILEGKARAFGVAYRSTAYGIDLTKTKGA